MTNLQQLQEEGESEFIKDFCRTEPYRDTYLHYFKGILEKNFDLIPTPRTICEWIREEREKAFKAGQQDMLERVMGVIKYERSTWAKESIGDKALQSLEMAVETLKALDNLNQR
jgi:hypothetical protein